MVVGLDIFGCTHYYTPYRVYKMRTNIVIDDRLVEEAMALAGLKTKREAVNKALEEYVRALKKKDLRELKGKVRFAEGYDPKRLRPR